MPFLVPIIVWVGTTLAVSTLTATLIVSTVIMTGVNFAIKGITGLFGKNASQSSLLSDAANHSVTSRQPAAPRRVIYGEDRVGGIYTALATGGTNNENLHAVITFTGHEIDSYQGIYFENEQVIFDGSGVATGKYAGYAWIEYKFGAAGEAAFPNMIADLPSYWTSAHRQDGCASIHLKLKFNQDLFPSGVPNVRAQIRGKKVYDPRDLSTGWSDNAALCARDFLTADFGYGSRPTELDDAAVSAAANICDESVATHSGTESRYTVNGTFDMSEAPQDVLKDLISAMSGRCVWTGGQWRLYAGAWRPPTLAYGDDDLREGQISVTARRSRRDRCNGVKGTFIDPFNEYQPNDFPAYTRNAARLYAQDDFLLDDAGVTNFRGDWSLGFGAIAVTDGVSKTSGSIVVYYVCDVAHTASADKEPGVGANWQSYFTAAERIWRDIDLRFTKSPSMAQRLAKIELESNRREKSAVIPYKLGAYQSCPPDVAEYSHARFGWVNKTFELADLQLAFDTSGDVPVLAPTHTLTETDSDVYTWSADDDLPTTTAASLPLPSTDNSGTTLGSIGVSTVAAGVVQLSWTAPTDASALAGDNQVFFKLNSSPTWLLYSTVPGDQTTEVVGGLVSGNGYDYKVRNINTDLRGGVPATITNQIAP